MAQRKKKEEEQHIQIEHDFKPSDYSISHYTNLARMDIVNLFLNPYRTQERIIGEYKKEDLKKALKAPELIENQRMLRRISRYAYNASMHYRRLIGYVSEILLFRYYTDPYGFELENVNEKRLKNSFTKINTQLAKMKIPHEYSKIMKTAMRDGVFFGYVHSNKDSFFIQQLDPEFCMIDGEVDGTYTFAFNFNYFLTYPERIAMFPREFQDKYLDYVEQRGNKKQQGVAYWQSIDYENSICIKVDDTTSYYPIPPFVPIFADILDIQDFKDLQKTKGEMDNYKLITMKIPQKTSDKANFNEFLLSPNFVKEFYENTKSQLPVQVGLTATTMELDVLDFERDKPDKNKVLEAQQIMWDTAGVPSLLFQSGDTSIGLNNSIIVDESMLFFVLRQFESWTNRFMFNKQDKKYKWAVKFLDMTRFNEKDVQDGLAKAAQYGGHKAPWMAAMGYSPTSVTHLTYFENDVLKLHEKLIPLQSSHTQSITNGDKGRPEKDVTDLGDKGLEARDKQTNDTRNQ